MNVTHKPPSGPKRPKPERGTAKARAHLRAVKALPCVICHAPPPSDAHHIICERYSTARASDFETIPLCKPCHQDGPGAIHNGKASWVARHGPDYSYLALVADWIKGATAMPLPAIGQENY